MEHIGTNKVNSGLPLERGGSSAVGRGRSRLYGLYVYKLLMMGKRMPETC